MMGEGVGRSGRGPGYEVIACALVFSLLLCQLVDGTWDRMTGTVETPRHPSRLSLLQNQPLDSTVLPCCRTLTQRYASTPALRLLN
jgi:hypothetical protein